MYVKQNEVIPVSEHNKFKIWYQQLDENGEVIGTGVYHKEYVVEGTARNMADRLYGGKRDIIYKIAVINPFIKNYTDAVCDICGCIYQMPVDPTYNLPKKENRVTIMSRHAIPTTNQRYWFSKHMSTCDDCIRKIKSFIDSIPKVGEKDG